MAANSRCRQTYTASGQVVDRAEVLSKAQACEQGSGEVKVLHVDCGACDVDVT